MHKCKRMGILCEEKEDGTLWLVFGNESVRVDYCPFCGKESAKKLSELDEVEEVGDE